VDEINRIMQNAADGKIVGYSEVPLVSIDYNHVDVSSNFDAGMTKVIGDRLVKVGAWYDNEWAFSNRMLDTASRSYTCQLKRFKILISRENAY